MPPSSSQFIRLIFRCQAGLPALPSFAAKTLTLERTLSDLINQAYGLTPEEVQLLWATATLRMPF